MAPPIRLFSDFLSKTGNPKVDTIPTNGEFIFKASVLFGFMLALARVLSRPGGIETW
jgi:hypothetical protein